jgi:TetR/AcrR family transcriptional repressor of nem operon
MPKSRVETAKTRERIVKAAGAEFAANGISEAALARVMSAAGLTHGGFYRHFASKDQLVQEACGQTFLTLVASLELLVKGKPHEQALPLTGGSLCVARSWRPADNGAPPGRSGERTGAERRPDPSRRHGRIPPTVPADCQPPGDGSAPKRAEMSMAIVSAMVGAIILARVAPDSRTSDSVLEATRDYIIRSMRRQR